MAGVNYSFAPSSIQPIDGVITFSESPIRKLSMPHDYALVLTIKVRKHLMKRILVDPSSVVDLLYLLALLRLDYNNLCSSGRVLVGFNESQTNLMREVVLPVLSGPVIALVTLIVIDLHSSFNAIFRCTWIHAMKAWPSSYLQMLSFCTPLG